MRCEYVLMLTWSTPAAGVPERHKSRRERECDLQTKSLTRRDSLPISTAIIGCDSVEQVEECVELAHSFTPLSQAQMAAMEAKVEPVAKQALFFRLMPR